MKYITVVARTEQQLTSGLNQLIADYETHTIIKIIFDSGRWITLAQVDGKIIK